jgi:hypothetical protein
MRRAPEVVVDLDQLNIAELSKHDRTVGGHDRDPERIGHWSCVRVVLS